MTLTPEFEFCKTFTEYLFNHPLSYPFRDSSNSEIPMNQQNQNTIDLVTIQKNLTNQKYKNSNQWKDDIMLVWENSLNGTNPWQKKAAEFFKAKCHKKLEHLPKTAIDTWLLELYKTTNQLNKLIKYGETSPIDTELVTRLNELELGPSLMSI